MKVLGWIIGIVVLAVVGAIAYVVLNSGDLIKRGIERVGPEVLGAPVKVSQVDLDLAAGSARITGLSLGNPAGYSDALALQVGDLTVVLDPAQIGESVIVLKRVLIDGADVLVEAQGQRTNFQQLMDNVTQAVGASEGGAADSAQNDETRLIIERFDFTNTRARLVSDVLGEKALQIPDIHLNNLGRESNGATGAQLARQIMQPLSAAVTRAAVAEGLDIEGAKERVRERIRDKIGDRLQGLTDKLND